MYMPYEHAVAGDVCVPAFLLTVFEEEEFIRLGSPDYSGHILGDRVQSGRYSADNLAGFHPSEGVALKRSVEGRCTSAVVVGAVVHSGPCARGERGCIRCGIEVGKSHHVGEFVDECAHSVGTRAFPLV